MTDEVRNRIQGFRYVRAAELARVGYVDAVIARETPAGLVLVDGHLRADLAADAEIPVLVVDIDEGEAAEVLATLDPLAAAAGADETALAELLAGLPDDDGLDELLGGIHDLPATIGEDPSPAEEPLGSPPEPRSERGQVWQLGPHRVMCGDSTVPEHVAGLLDGAEPECILTDPPYNSGADRLAGSKGTTATTNRRVANDELSSRGYVALLKQALAGCPAARRPTGSAGIYRVPSSAMRWPRRRDTVRGRPSPRRGRTRGSGMRRSCRGPCRASVMSMAPTAGMRTAERPTTARAVRVRHVTRPRPVQDTFLLTDGVGQ
ncbi:hypothetical protein [Candidatus Palauibacter sp.]|uniref:hypothetical protein n=1 Tax=Candidatus Palauibacter sp. TaxID=3101350 RepID=UPI003CC502EF